MKSLLIDVGSTFIKYSVYSLKEGTLFSDKTPFPEPVINDGVRFVVSRKELCDKIFAILNIGEEYACSFALFSVQMHGYVARLCDGSFSEYVSWRDKSGRIDGEKFRTASFNDFGLTLSENLPVTKIDKTTVKEFYTLGSYISYILTGKNETHITDAFASGFFFSPSGEPNEFSLGMIMPSVCHEIKAVGEWGKMNIIAPFGDHQISFLGSGAGEESYLINIGTGAQVCCLAPYGYPDGKHQKRPYFDKEKCLYSFCGLHGIDGKSRGQSEILGRILDVIGLVPKKKSAIVGGGGGEALFPKIESALKKLGITSQKADFNVGNVGLISLFEQCQKEF